MRGSGSNRLISKLMDNGRAACCTGELERVARWGQCAKGGGGLRDGSLCRIRNCDTKL